MRRLALRLGGFLVAAAALSAATFGTAVPVIGGPVDLVLDEARNQLYLVDFNLNAVQVYSIPGRRFLPPIRVGTQPAGAALSADNRFLYVTNFGSSSLSVINLDQNAVVQSVVIPAPPEGVAVGADGRVLITTLGLGPAANRTDTLIRFDPGARFGEQLSSVVVPPPPPIPPQLPPQVPGRVYLSFRGSLRTTADAQFIIGMNTPTGASTVVFVYEVASGQVLRTRTVPGVSTVLSVSPDGSRFMAGLRLFDTATLNVLAQQDASNAPFPIAANFNLLQNVGGSVFAADGTTLYSAFNIAPGVLPQPRPNSATLLVSNPRNLGIRLGIQLPESVFGKMIASSNGQNLYALSESGLLLLPVGQMNLSPILAPETTVVRLSANQCERGAAARSIRINNAGRGVLRFAAAAPAAAAGLSVQAEGVQAPGGLRFTMNPAVTRRIGSTLTLVQLQSQEAINIPPVIRVYQNWLNAETRTTTFPVEVNVNNNEGLADIVVDNARQRVYLANSGKNQIEVFDLRSQTLLAPIEVGQLPRSMALGLDGRTLYVANTGGEWISMVNLEEGREYDRIVFPAVPFNVAQGPLAPRVIAQGIYGLQIFASAAANAAGNLWTTSGRSALPRGLSNAIGTLNIPFPVSMTSTPGNESILLLAGNGTAYLYDSLIDDYVLARTVMSAPMTSYYGNVGAGPEGRYYLANRAILNAALVPVGGFAGGAIVIPPPAPPPGPAPPPAPPPDPGPRPVPGQVAPGGALRDVPAVAPVNATTYARFSTAPQANANANPTGDPQPVVELVNIATEQVIASVPVSEAFTVPVFTNQRANIPSRLMAVDNRGANAYVITASGLSVASLAPARPAARPLITSRSVVHAAAYTSDISPGSLISIFGQNLGEDAAAGSLPLPSMLGGTCVTFGDVTVPLLMTSAVQINAQVPTNLRAGAYAVTVRSPAGAAASAPAQVRVAASSPGIFANTATGEAALFHADDFSPVTRQDPARRDEVLVLFATGLPPAAGVNLQPGAPAPAQPLATTVRPKVFIGDPRISEAEMIVEWSGFAPGFVGLNQINIRVHGDRIRGERLPVSIEIGNVSSPLAGPLVPVTYVR